MNTETQEQETSEVQDEIPPNEVGGVHVEGFVKIYDPENDEVFVETRG